MRDQVLTYLGTKKLGGYTLSQQLPYDTTGYALYLKNPKSVFVGMDQLTSEIFIATMSANSIDLSVTTVQVFFSNDAKSLPSDYSALVDTIKSAQDLYIDNGFFKRDVEVETEFENDLMTTTITLRFYKLLT